MRRTSATLQKVGATPFATGAVKASHFLGRSIRLALALCAPPNLHAFSAAMKANGAA
jgi:hypothetical protein